MISAQTARTTATSAEPMDIFILRHGDAARQAASDAERPLTARGHTELHAVLEASQHDLQHVSHMLVSPYVRALQTSQVAAEYLSASVIVDVSERLVPEADPQKLLDYLQTLQQTSQPQGVLLVSHQPLVGVFLDRLCGFEVGRYRLGTGALAAVSADVVAADLGHLHWLRQPEDM